MNATHGAIAPGRVNLIGEHTDYSEGYVLPLAIDRWCVALGRANGVQADRVYSTAMSALVELAHDARPSDVPSWARYPMGVLCLVRRRLGSRLPHMDIALHSSVPPGAGLSSSAALEASVATLCERVADVSLEPLEKAKLCQQAEREWAGVPCGIMDQIASVSGVPGHALLIDCRTLGVTPVRLPDPGRVCIVVIDSRVKHALADGAYAQRAGWCERAAQGLGVHALRDATRRMIADRGSVLSPDEAAAANHVVSENARVLRAAHVLCAGQAALRELGRLMNASHESLHAQFRVTCPETDFLARAARSIPGVFGSRMTGGGFGGAVVVLCRPSAVVHLRRSLAPAYRRRFGRMCTICAVRAVGGVGEVSAEG